MKVLVVDSVPVHVLISIIELERVQASVDLNDQLAQFKIHQKIVCVGLKPEIDVLDSSVESSKDEDFTTATSGIE